MTKKSNKKNKREEDESSGDEDASNRGSSSEEESDYSAESSEDEEIEVEPKNSKGKAKEEKDDKDKKEKSKKQDKDKGKKSSSSGSGNKKNSPSPSKGKSGGKGNCAPPPQPDVPSGSMPITNDPFEPSNNLTVNIPYRYLWNPSDPKALKGLQKLDIMPFIRDAVEKAHLSVLDYASNSYVSLDSNNLRFFVTSLRMKALGLSTLPYPLKIDFDLPIPNKVNLFLNEIVASSKNSTEKERLRKLNACNVTIPENFESKSTDDICLWRYLPRYEAKRKMLQYSNIMMGAKNMWGDNPSYIKATNSWLVEQNTQGISVLMSSENAHKVRPDTNHKGLVWVPNEDKINVDNTWAKSVKSWGILETFGLNDKGKEKIYMTVGRSDFMQTEENLPVDYWTNLKNTTSAHHDAEGQKDILNKNHVVDLTFMITLGAPLS